MKKQLLSALLGTVAISALPAQADTIGFELGVKAWNTELTGDYIDPGLGTIDLAKDADLDSEIATDVYFALEHPIPAAPNVRLANTAVDIEKGEALDLSQTDVTLYWQLLDNIVEIDLGLGARMHDATIENTVLAADVYENDTTMAMLYFKLQGNLPVTGLGIGGVIQTGAASGDKATDIDIYLRYESSIGLGVALGYRSIDLDMDFEDADEVANDLEADVTLDGGYLNVFYHF